LTRDPYGYALRSPLNFTDPSGLSVGSWFADRWDDFTCGLSMVCGWIGDHEDGIRQAPT
jgi:hypothetical protein